MLNLRIPGESDSDFRLQALRAARIARVLVDAALHNHCIQALIADPLLPYSESSVRVSPAVRVEYEQAIAIGDIGSCFSATSSKHWGRGPHILPLEPHDPVDPFRILYLYRSGSLYNRRFEQRKRMKELLGARYRKLVGEAQHFTKKLFLARLTSLQAAAIRRILGVERGQFWRAAKGREFIQLRPRDVQLELPFADDDLA